MNDLGALSVTAVTVGFIHCLCGPDHYVPFVAMSRVGVWSLKKTLVVTVLCGVGHVLGSALLGSVGIALGLIVFQLQAAEMARGTLAGWLFIAFGLAYFLWGILHAVRCRRAVQAGGEATGSKHGTAEPADVIAKKHGRLVPWLLFTLFLFGPCEPLIPLLMYPAARADVWSVIWVTFLFGLSTLVTMTALVCLIHVGSLAVRIPLANTYGHALAGFIVLSCGLAVTAGL